MAVQNSTEQHVPKIIIHKSLLKPNLPYAIAPSPDPVEWADLLQKVGLPEAAIPKVTVILRQRPLFHTFFGRELGGRYNELRRSITVYTDPFWRYYNEVKQQTIDN